jgi:hypothetical protein
VALLRGCGVAIGVRRKYWKCFSAGGPGGTLWISETSFVQYTPNAESHQEIQKYTPQKFSVFDFLSISGAGFISAPLVWGFISKTIVLGAPCLLSSQLPNNFS